MTMSSQSQEFRAAVQKLVRSLGMLEVRQTPCGQPFSVSQAHTLMYLAPISGDADLPTQQKLANYLGLDKSTVNRLLQNLNNRGLVQIQPNRVDKRAKMVSLTPQGQTMAAQLNRSSQAMFHFSQSDHRNITRTVKQLADAIQQSKTPQPMTTQHQSISAPRLT